MLFEFLTQYKKEMIQLCREKVLAASELKPTSELLERGLPVFYDELIDLLRTIDIETPEAQTEVLAKNRVNAAVHGKESLRLGYTISQVVHAYGAVCQTITEFVQLKSFKMSPHEFRALNLSLDCAIAEAVTEFEKGQNEKISLNESERLGFLIHEFGNSLAAASIAHRMIQSGRVGASGSTSQVLTSALERMRSLINTTLLQIRLQRHDTVTPSLINLAALVQELKAAAELFGTAKELSFTIDVDPSLQLTADRNLIYSALSNLINNAVKFTKAKGNISVRAKELTGKKLLIEIEDQCGGLPAGIPEDLFELFVQKGDDKSGMGLGLSLSRQAIERSKGTLTARDIPGKGCVFIIELPKGKTPSVASAASTKKFKSFQESDNKALESEIQSSQDKDPQALTLPPRNLT